ncbi:unnamed protein product [Paramecium primaurelia]|uniref:Cilia- and flagella-associated protein 61 N-terminal domain-containing protein n=1 Tax=Paramecium primaurelia TaxID=5886 RepID=A0A8S1QCR4_PARPR|nr:unnamed protein product [Paramecium primaurelia]
MSFFEQQGQELQIRKADLDDYDEIVQLMQEEGEEDLQQLYAYPKILTLFERSYLSVTVLDSQNNIIGNAVFDDCPQGVTGQVDFKHENLWEQWIHDGWNIDFHVSSFNCLWMTFFFLAKKRYQLTEEQQLQITRQIFQKVYDYLNVVNGIFFLRRNEAKDATQQELDIALENLFELLPKRQDFQLKFMQGVNQNCEIYYSPSSMVIDLLEIRMAREEDHDDLAAIFNRQSDVHTEEFGEFFIADLIATQNQTRRQARNYRSDGKAIVGQVGDKAVGLMSISSDIDYRLLGQCFDLEVFDNLYKAEYMEAIRNRLDQLALEEQINKQIITYKKQIELTKEAMKCHIVGQRLYLQQYCFDRDQEIKQKIDDYGQEDLAKTLTPQVVTDMINGWLKDYQVFKPSDLFLEYPNLFKDLECITIKPIQILLEALEFFGLPKGYMNGEGHWKDWAKKKEEEQKALSLKRPKRQQKKTNKKAKKEDKDEDIFKPPPYFDLGPFLQAFTKFTSVSAETRTQFRKQIEMRVKELIMEFCTENGEMDPSRHVDLIEFPEILRNKGFDIGAPMGENLAFILECFGELEVDNRIVQKIKEEKDAKKKDTNLKKVGDDAPKPVDVLQKMTSYQEFIGAIQKLKKYDQMMCRLQLVRSNTIQSEVEEIIQEEQNQIAKLEAAKQIQRTSTEYDEYVSQLQSIDQLPEVPKTAQNAVVINLFCIDERFESRSLDFVERAFELFPDREYLVLTQPYTVQETTLLQHFLQVPRKKHSTFEHVLYIYHRNSLDSHLIGLRKLNQNEWAQCQFLVENLLDKDQIERDVRNVNDNETFIVYCKEEIIGLYCMRKYVNLQYLKSHFCIQDHILIAEHPKHLHTRLLHGILNPLFAKQTRFILREICRLMDKTCIMLEIHDRTLLPDIFQEFNFVRSRAFAHFLKQKWDWTLDQDERERMGAILDDRDPYDQNQAPFSLAMLTKKQLSSVKVSNNSRIVVVGASDTGLSFIESLLTIKDINFTNIILLAPGGLLTMHVKHEFEMLKAMSTNYTLEELRALMLDARVQVVDAKMVKLDKKGNRIKIDKNAFIPFDYLIITVGLIDTELQSREKVSFGLSKSPYYKTAQFINGLYSIDDPYLYQHFKRTGFKNSNIDLLTRKKKPQNITIYGNTLSTITFMNGLLNRGVHPSRIHYVMPPKTFQKQTKFENNKQRLEQEDKIIFDPDQFENDEVKNKVFDIMVKMGINIHYGFTLFEMKVGKEGFGLNSEDVLQQVIFRKQADNYEELKIEIQRKEQELQELKDNSENNMSKDMYGEQEEGENQLEVLAREIEQLKASEYDYLELESRFFITSGLIDIDKEIFNIIHENGLVYNGRLIVKSNFQTTQENIFACGKICEFSQRYKHHSVGKSLRLDKYNGRELGQKLSKCILEQLNLSYLTSQTYSVDELPQLYMPIGQGGIVPHKLYYYHIKKNDFSKPKHLQQLPSKPILSDNFNNGNGHFLQFDIDPNGLIESVTYFGSEAVHIPSLLQFIELSVKYLNKLEQRGKLINNVSEFLSENWAIALYHEWFSEFRHITKSEMLKNELIDQVLEKAQEYARDGRYMDENFFEEIKKLITRDIIENIQEGTIEFIRENQNHLPMYFIPKKKLN